MNYVAVSRDASTLFVCPYFDGAACAIPVVLLCCRFASGRTTVCRKKRLRHAFKMELRVKTSNFGSILGEVGLPEKTIAKNFVSLVTYPHSDSKRLENCPFTKQT